MSDLRILAALPLIVAGELLAALTDLTDRAAAAIVGLPPFPAVSANHLPKESRQ